MKSSFSRAYASCATAIVLFSTLGLANQAHAEVALQPLPTVEGISTSTPIQRPNTVQKRIAVLDFDSGSISGDFWMGMSGDFGNGPSKAVSNMMVDRLVNGNVYTVVERSKIEAVMAEIKMSQGKSPSFVDPDTVVKVGRLLGVDAMLTGSITEFNVDRKGFRICLPIIGCVERKEDIASVEVTVRLIEVETGRIIASSTGKGEKKKGDISTWRGGTGSDLKGTLLKAATDAAVDSVVPKINAASGLIASYKPQVESAIADISSSGEVTFEKGSEVGIQKGMVFSLRQITDTILDSKDKPIRSIVKNVGLVEITEVAQGYSVGKIVEGNPLTLAASYKGRGKKDPKKPEIGKVMGYYTGNS
jgi:curli biogenesis system outer membrane secretion channel CsgG